MNGISSGEGAVEYMALLGAEKDDIGPENAYWGDVNTLMPIKTQTGSYPWMVFANCLMKNFLLPFTPYYYATVGNATSVARAVEFGREIGKILVADGVQGVILTST